VIDLDLDAFLNPDIFGQEAFYTSTSGISRTINVVLETPYSSPDGLGIVGVSDSAPTALCKTTDVSDASRGATLSIGDVTYNVTEASPDGDGFTILKLSKD
jgi:hypothetical protein